jgi:hypothetical protein
VVWSEGGGRTDSLVWALQLDCWSGLTKSDGLNGQSGGFRRTDWTIASSGLKDAGYNYVNIDDCWSNLEQRRNETTSQILPDYNKFPDGIQGLTEKMHAQGLRMGIYSDAGALHLPVASPRKKGALDEERPKIRVSL